MSQKNQKCTLSSVFWYYLQPLLGHRFQQTRGREALIPKMTTTKQQVLESLILALKSQSTLLQVHRHFSSHPTKLQRRFRPPFLMTLANGNMTSFAASQSVCSIFPHTFWKNNSKHNSFRTPIAPKLWYLVGLNWQERADK